MFYAVKSRETGETRQLWCGRDGHVVTELGESCAPWYIHSELFGGIGHVDPVGDVPQALRDFLATEPKPDNRRFGKCGSR